MKFFIQKMLFFFQLLLLCLLFASPSVMAYLWVRSGPGMVYVNPNDLHFATGKAGDVVSLSGPDIGGGLVTTTHWHTTSPQKKTEIIYANYYESYVSARPSGNSESWFKLTDALEFSAQSTYYNYQQIENSLSYHYSSSDTYYLEPDGATTQMSFWEPWAKGLTLKFRLTQDIVDTPVYIPAMLMFHSYSLYSNGNESGADLLTFGEKYPPQWTFSISSGFITAPNAACSVSPSSLNVDFGDMSPGSVNGRQQKKELQITCNKDAALKFSISSVDSTMENGFAVLKMSNRNDIVARVKTDDLASQSFFHVSVTKDVPTSIPLFFELKSTKSEVSPGEFNGSGWVIFSYE
ncbi:fimbrial protein [Salmonella enterica]|nr:fimbrial protein [Salmonella enterica]